MKDIDVASECAYFTEIFEEAVKLGIKHKLEPYQLAGILGGMSTFLIVEQRSLEEILASKRRPN